MKWIAMALPACLLACNNNSPNESVAGDTSASTTTPPTSMGQPDSAVSNPVPSPDSSPSGSGDSSSSSSDYCDQYLDNAVSYFCEDFRNLSPRSLVGQIPPMSFRDQTFREYTIGEVFDLADPDASTANRNVVNLHTDSVDGQDFSSFAANTRSVAENWDITAHSRDGYVRPGTGAGFNDRYWWTENALLAEHGHRCGPPPDLDQVSIHADPGERAYTFMERFFTLPSDYNGDELTLAPHWLPENENALSDNTGLHHVVRYEDMIYVCADHLMTAAYAAGASKLSLTPNHLLDTSSGEAVVEFAVSTYRTAGRDYWQLDLTPLDTHLQLPEGDVVADANGKAVNGFNINTELDESMEGPMGVMGGINVFRTLMLKNGDFLENGNYISPDDPEGEFTRAQIANPGNPERLDLYANAPENLDWVITHSSYNQVMYDHLNGDDNPDITLHNVTDNRSRALFRLTILKTPVAAGWSEQADRWDQVSLCMPEYGNGCVGEYIVPELSDELLVQFTHYAYNTTKSCSAGGRQPHDTSDHATAFQTTCHANTYHWDNFYLSPSTPFTVIKARERTAMGSQDGDVISLVFEEPSPANAKLRFNALTGGTSNDTDGETTLEISFDEGATWHTPHRQFEPENNFDKFRSYFTGIGNNEFIPEGVERVYFRANTASFRDAFWIRDASFWTVAD